MYIQFNFNHNDRNALLRHYKEFLPSSGDVRGDARLADAPETLAMALMEADQRDEMSEMHS